MVKQNLRYIYNEKGEKISVIISRKDFERMIEKLEDFADYQTVKERGGGKEKTYTVEEVMRNLGMGK